MHETARIAIELIRCELHKNERHLVSFKKHSSVKREPRGGAKARNSDEAERTAGGN